MADSKSFPFSLILAGIGLFIQLLAIPWRLDILGLVCVTAGLAIYNRRDDSLLHRMLAPIGYTPHVMALALGFAGVGLVIFLPQWHWDSVGTLLLTLGIGLWGNKRPTRPDTI